MSQQQKQAQKLAMTQQLQQSIQILQFSTEELAAFAEAKALENPLIDLRADTQYTTDFPITSRSYANQDEEDNYMNRVPDYHSSLFESLIDQIHLSYHNTYLQTLVLFLAEYIDVNGYLTTSLEEAVGKTRASATQMLDTSTLSQQLDPAGVGARNLRECLMLQIERDNTAPNLAYILLGEEFDALVGRKWGPLVKKLGIELAEIQLIFDYTQTLSPTPENISDATEELYVRPDLAVQIKEDRIVVISNKVSRPTLNFQENYFKRMQETDDKEVQEYIKDKKNEFERLERAVNQRGDTILRVGQEIVHRQEAFFLEANRPLKPMTLKEIADALSIHESTVSRAVNGKYLETTFGVFELRLFLSTSILSSEEDGEDVSTTMVKKQLQKLIDEEVKSKPLSDRKLVERLRDSGMEISRRAVAKYHEALGVPSSSKRKRYE